VWEQPQVLGRLHTPNSKKSEQLKSRKGAGIWQRSIGSLAPHIQRASSDAQRWHNRSARVLAASKRRLTRARGRKRAGRTGRRPERGGLSRAWRIRAAIRLLRQSAPRRGRSREHGGSVGRRRRHADRKRSSAAACPAVRALRERGRRSSDHGRRLRLGRRLTRDARRGRRLVRDGLARGRRSSAVVGQRRGARLFTNSRLRRHGGGGRRGPRPHLHARHGSRAQPKPGSEHALALPLRASAQVHVSPSVSSAAPSALN